MWSTVVLKESVFLFGVALLLNAATRAFRSKTLVSVAVMTVLGSTVIIMLRPIALIFSLMPLLAVVVFGGGHSSARPIRLLGLILFILCALVSVSDISNRLNDLGEVLSWILPGHCWTRPPGTETCTL